MSQSAEIPGRSSCFKLSSPRHSCKYCGKKYLSMSHLKDHEVNHTGVYPLRCGECGRGFKRPGALEGHKCAVQHQDPVLPTVAEDREPPAVWSCLACGVVAR